MGNSPLNDLWCFWHYRQSRSRAWMKFKGKIARVSEACLVLAYLKHFAPIRRFLNNGMMWCMTSLGKLNGSSTNWQQWRGCIRETLSPLQFGFSRQKTIPPVHRRLWTEWNTSSGMFLILLRRSVKSKCWRQLLIGVSQQHHDGQLRCNQRTVSAKLTTTITRVSRYQKLRHQLTLCRSYCRISPLLKNCFLLVNWDTFNWNDW